MFTRIAKTLVKFVAHIFPKTRSPRRALSAGASREFWPVIAEEKVIICGCLFTCVVYTNTIIHLSVGE